jgi:hypothetical protein
VEGKNGVEREFFQPDGHIGRIIFAQHLR